jgi:hypothetical protein
MNHDKALAYRPMEPLQPVIYRKNGEKYEINSSLASQGAAATTCTTRFNVQLFDIFIKELM